MNEQPGSACVTVLRWNSETVHPTRLARLKLRPELLRLDFEDDLVDDVLLAASELVANATEHAVGPYELRLLTDGTEHVLECHDASWELPPTTLRILGEEDRLGGQEGFRRQLMGERGRGLSLLSSMFHGCISARRTVAGKAVFIAFGSRSPVGSAPS
ncbi:ATP-binding protein [Streptacidiphilus pinicola]|uniref:ATP-binding protein n=1 Tax=Streptacidiphilus pinicola TaxID=2219663 RepID=UPI001057C5F8|nr:ATP-binding protein [Streptacidiphilus pinicola]